MNIFKVFTVIILILPLHGFTAVRIASILKLEDAYAKFPQDINNSFLTGLKILKAESKFEVKSFSHDGTPESLGNAITAATKFNPDIIFGGETSAYSLIIARAFPEQVFITPTASSSMLLEINKSVFRLSQSDEQYLGIIDYLLSKKGIKDPKIGVFNNISFPNTKAISEKAVEKLKSNFKIDPIEIKAVAGDELTASKYEPFIKEKVNVVVLYSFENDLRKTLSALNSKGLNPIFVGADGWGRDEFLSEYLIKNKIPFTGYRVVYWDPTRKDAEFINIKSKIEKDLKQKIDFFHAIGFDSAKFIVDTINKNQSIKDFKKTALSMKYKGLLTTKDLSYSKELTPQKTLYGQRILNGSIEYLGEISHE